MSTIDSDYQPKIVHRTGITDTRGRDYSLINRVRSLDKTNDEFLKRSRSISRGSATNRDLKQTIEIKRKDSSNWTERGTQASIGGVLGVVKNHRERSRSRVRDESEGREESDNSGFFARGRSSSRPRADSESGGEGAFISLRRSISRSLSRVRGGKEERRGRSKDRNDATAKGTTRNKLPPTGPGRNIPPRSYNNQYHQEHQEPEQEPEVVNDVIDKLLAERLLLDEVVAQCELSPRSSTKKSFRNEQQQQANQGITEEEAMQLDRFNTKIHVACLLHHSSTDIIELLEHQPEMAKLSNSANETPLHYAAMDKMGVSKEVLKKLIQSYPEAVKKPNVQHCLPLHLAMLIGAPSLYVVKTFLKMYPKAAMIQSDFNLVFEEEMADAASSREDEINGEFSTYKPKQVTGISGIANRFANGAPNQGGEDGREVETGFSPLHLAVINSASPSVIELIVKVNSRCIHLKTSRGRTALDCAQYIVRQHWLYGTDDESTIQNTFGAIEILEKALQQD